MNAHKWLRLSETLRGPKHPATCQNCSAGDVPLTRWMEHDDNDRREPITVVLCGPCGDKLIEPHPRLYQELLPDEPMPGCMPICIDCGQRDGTSCTSPLAQINGGPGLKYSPEPTPVHVCRSPRRSSGWRWINSGPIESCSGKDA